MSEERLSYEDTLAYSQGLRRQVVDHYMEVGVPKDPKDVETVLKALKDMDSTAINDRKNTIDEKTADGSKEVAMALMDVVRMQQNSNPFERQPDGSVPEPPVASKEQLGDFQLVDGEEEIGVVSEKADDFLKRMDEQRLASYKLDDEE